MEKFTENVFWNHKNCCPRCKYINASVYLPDLLNGPQDFTCNRPGCGAGWSVVLNEDAKERVREYLLMRQEMGMHLYKANEIRQKLQ